MKDSILQEFSHKYGEPIAMGGASVGWASIFMGFLHGAAIILTVLLTAISLYLVLPRFLDEFSERGIRIHPKKSEEKSGDKDPEGEQ